MKNYTNLVEFMPPYCPNARCKYHRAAPPGFCKSNGTTPTHKPPYSNRRFKCKDCGKQFSANAFSPDFRKKVGHLSEDVLFCSVNGMSNNSIASDLGVSETTVRNRLRGLAIQALCFEKKMAVKKIEEDVVYDGFETFTHSQFSPCYVNTAVGKRSLFIYSNTLSPLNRKGRMTQVQKTRLAELVRSHGPYPRDAVFRDSCYVFELIGGKADGGIRKFVRKNAFDDKAHLWSPAMYVGVADKILAFEDVFGERLLPTQFALDQKERDFADRFYPFSREKIAL